MDSNYVYEYNVWQEEEEADTLSEDIDFKTVDTRYRYWFLKLHFDQAKPITHLVVSLLQKLHHCVSFYHQCVLTLKLIEFAKSINGGVIDKDHPPVQIGVGFVVKHRRVEERFEKVKVETKLLGERCVICLNLFREDEEISRTVCQHVFHHDCIFKWLNKRDSCPVCRFILSP